MKRLYINARFLLRRPTGVERYAYGMCRGLMRAGADIVLICPGSGEINNAYNLSGLSIVRFGVSSSHVWEQLILPWFFIGKKNYILVSFTGLGSILVRDKIMTIHDLSFLANPSWFSKPYYFFYRVMTPLAAKTSKKIVTVSEFSKREILRFYPFIKPERVQVIYSAVDRDKFHLTQCVERIDPKPYVLTVSSMDPRKNVERLICSFQGLDSCRLKIIGGQYKSFKSSKNIESGSNVDYLGCISDTELQHLYINATAFIFPSLYEGFGLPPIEAMICQCPVLVSDIPVLREVCADAALYFDPNDISSMQKAVQKVLAMNTEDRTKMIEKGLKNARRFSWEKSAETFMNIVKNL